MQLCLELIQLALLMYAGIKVFPIAVLGPYDAPNVIKLSIFVFMVAILLYQQAKLLFQDKSQNPWAVLLHRLTVVLLGLSARAWLHN